MQGMIDLERYTDEGDVLDTVVVNYDYTPGDRGCLWGDFPEPPTEPSVDIWVKDADVILTPEERGRAEEAAMEDARDRFDDRGRPCNPYDD